MDLMITILENVVIPSSLNQKKIFRKIFIVKMKRRIKAIIFDLGGVLNILCSTEDWLDVFYKIGAQKNIAKQAASTLDVLANNFNLGKYVNLCDFLQDLRNTLAIPKEASDQEILLAWNFQIIDFNPELYKLLKFREQFQIFVLSNTNQAHRDYNENIQYLKYKEQYYEENLPLSFQSLFTKVYYSHEIHYQKPDINAWQYILNDNPKLTADDYLFVDDIKEYVDIAKSLGMHVFHFDITKNSLDDIFEYIEQPLV